MNIKSLLESTNFPVREGWYIKPPKYPYITFNVNESVNCDDLGNKRYIEKNVEVNFYCESLEQKAIGLVEEVIKKFKVGYDKNTVYQNDCVLTYFNFILIEKEIAINE